MIGTGPAAGAIAAGGVVARGNRGRHAAAGDLFPLTNAPSMRLDQYISLMRRTRSPVAACGPFREVFRWHQLLLATADWWLGGDRAVCKIEGIMPRRILHLTQAIAAFCSLVGSGAVAGCATTRSSAAQSIVETESKQVVDCAYVREVHGTSGWGGVAASTGIENAKNEALDQATAAGATHVVWEALEAAFIPSARGKAYRCGGAPRPDRLAASSASRSETVASVPEGPSSVRGPGSSTLEPRHSRTENAKSFALVVGIETYREELPQASHAENDARRFAAFAETTLGVPRAHIRLLLGDRAGRSDIVAAIDEWLPRNAREPSATVFVYFSGHGAPEPETGDAYLVPYDANPAYLRSSAVSTRALYAALGRLPAMSMVFLDACFSGAGQRSVIAPGTRPLIVARTASVPERVVALTAAGAKETTGPASDGEHGLFTFHLLSALTGAADSNRDRNLSLKEIAGYVRLHVENEASLQNRDQKPQLVVPRHINPGGITVVTGLGAAAR